jgi:hypothetical protein
VPAPALLLFASALVAAIALREPFDVGSSIPLPDVVRDLKDHDNLAYPAHRWLGTLLERLHYPPEAVGVQWVKAAYHAPTDADVRRAARSLAEARLRAPSADAFRTAVCERVAYATRGGRQRVALLAAGVVCDPPSSW